jgi:hypothetical protein
VYLPIHHQAGARMINIQSTLRNVPDLCENVPFTVLFGGNRTSCTISTQFDMCIYACILNNVEMLVGLKIKNIGTAVNTICQGNLSACYFGHVYHRFISPALESKHHKPLHFEIY